MLLLAWPSHALSLLTLDYTQQTVPGRCVTCQSKHPSIHPSSQPSIPPSTTVMYVYVLPASASTPVTPSASATYVVPRTPVARFRCRSLPLRLSLRSLVEAVCLPVGLFASVRIGRVRPRKVVNPSSSLPLPLPLAHVRSRSLTLSRSLSSLCLCCLFLLCPAVLYGLHLPVRVFAFVCLFVTFVPHITVWGFPKPRPEARRKWTWEAGRWRC